MAQVPDGGVAPVRAIVGIDGDHSIDAVRAAIEAQDAQILGAVWLGGTEKAGPDADFGVEVVVGLDPEDAVRKAISRFSPEVYIDLSDEPVVSLDSRLGIASLVLSKGIAWRSPGATLTPPPRPKLTESRTVAVIATGKRVGKTAVAQELALRAADRSAIVAMGRGGPADPVVIEAGTISSIDDLVEISNQGRHAASDYLEDALLTSVRTIGTRRAAGGLTGEVAHTRFSDAVEAAGDASVLVFEGSGACVPPGAADFTVLCVPSALDPHDVTVGLGRFRPLIADAIVVIGEPNPELQDALRSVNPTAEVVGASFRPVPTEDIGDATAILATTSPDPAGQAALLPNVVGVTNQLSDRGVLVRELDALPPADVLLVEIKGAAIDTAVQWARGRGMRCVPIRNAVVGAEELFERLVGDE